VPENNSFSLPSVSNSYEVLIHAETEKLNRPMDFTGLPDEMRSIWAVQCRMETDSVKPDEIAQVIRANIDETVSVVYADGKIEDLFVHTVDEEGFVCDIAADMTQPRPCAYWVRFRDVREAHPADEASSAKRRSD